jgi:dTDP-4-amino-4,6-dideoxygalactose transaminase
MPEVFARAVTRRTRAVLPVHPFGLLADVPAIRAAVARVARGKSPAVVEDAACALGSSLRGRAAGTMGDAGCFSFHPRKILTTGEGGLVVTAKRALADRVKALRTHGLTRTAKGFRMDAPGLNYRMTDLQGALGLAQFERLDAILAERARLAGIYREALSRLPAIELPSAPPDRVVAAQSFVVLLRTRQLRARAQTALRRAGIETTFGTYCVPMLGWYRRTFGFTARSFPNAWGAQERSLTLPLYPGLDPASQERVIAVLDESLA